MIEGLIAGFGVTLQPLNLLLVVLGVGVGILAGAMPGLSAATTLALLLPFTYGIPPESSLILLAAAYVGAEYGGSISAIFINTPGTPGAVVTVLDGYQLTRRGFPLKALLASLVPGTVAGLLANVALITVSVPLVELALRFGAAEFFAIGVFGLAIIATLAGSYWVKGFLGAGLGLFLATIGLDAITGFPRFTFGVIELREGIGLIPALIGLLALSEVFVIVEELGAPGHVLKQFSRALPTWPEWKAMIPASLRGTVIGVVIGAIPGAGATIASIISYNEERRASKHPERFGQGAIEGVAAPEAANNAVVGGTLIPLLTLGIPGSASAAIMLSALLLHGVTPGPELFTRNPEVVYGLFASQFMANVAMLLLGLAGLTLWIRIVEVPKPVLAPAIVAVCFVGAYSAGNSLFNVGIAVVMGIGGYLLRKLDFPIAPIVLALVLGFLVETNFRRMLLIAGGDWGTLLQHPIALVLLALAAVTVAFPIVRGRRRAPAARPSLVDGERLAAAQDQTTSARHG